MEANHHEMCERNEGYCHDNLKCSECEKMHEQELAQEAAHAILGALEEILKSSEAAIAALEGRMP